MDEDQEKHSVRIPGAPEEVFERFTREISSWWPLARQRKGQPRPGTIVMERREAGRILERLKGGEHRIWGTVRLWDPPHRLTVSFNHEEGDSLSETVDVRFEPSDGGTLVILSHTGWKALGPAAPAAREDYDSGWEPVLGRLAQEP